MKNHISQRGGKKHISNLIASVFKILHKHERTWETMHNMAKWMKLKTAKEGNTQHLPTNEIKTPCRMSEKL